MRIPEHEFKSFDARWMRSRSYDYQVAVIYRKLELLRVVLNLVTNLRVIHSEHFDDFVHTFDQVYKPHSDQFAELLQQDQFRTDFFRILEHDHFNPERM